MVLVDHQIKDYVDRRVLVIENFSPKCVQPATYDLRIGNEVFLSTEKGILDISKNGGHFRIDPGATAMLHTHEYLELPPNILGRPGIKSSIARKGLFPSIGIQADPGFKGCLFINLINLTPLTVSMDYLDTILSIEFHELENTPTEGYKGEYQGKRKLSSNDIQPLLAYEGLNLAQIHKGFAKLSKNIETVASFGDKIERLVERQNRQMEKMMAHNSRLVNEIKTLVQFISSQSKEHIVVLRDVDREQAKREIEALFKEGGTIYYGDIVERLGLDLELVVDICNELEGKGIIGMLKS